MDTEVVEDVGVAATEAVGMEEVAMEEVDMGVEDTEEADIELVDMEAVDKLDGAEMEVEDEGVVRGVIISINSISFVIKAEQDEMTVLMI